MIWLNFADPTSLNDLLFSIYVDVFLNLNMFLGTCMEALCSPRSADNVDTVNLCLESLRTVLECEWGQLQLTADPQLAVEVLNVMHRFGSRI